jgi:hypothetical protein
MDCARFDTLTRSLTGGSSRRRLLAGLTSGLLALVPLGSGSFDATAKKKGKRKKKKKKKPPASLAVTCAPTCAGKVCGDDGCGGTCGDPCPTAETCVAGRCVCPAGTERCGPGCVVPCPTGAPRNPVTCGCCAPNGSPFCTPGPTTSCCSGNCIAIDPSFPNFCGGKGAGAPCQFAAQCTSNSCENGQCAA